MLKSSELVGGSKPLALADVPQSQIEQADVCFAKDEATELYWSTGSNAGIGVKIGSPTTAKFAPNTIVWKQEGGAIRPEAVAKAECNDADDYPLSVNIAVNSIIAFEGALMSFRTEVV